MRGMTAGDWNRLNLPMFWGAFLSYVQGNLEKCFLDLRTDAPDGVYKVADAFGPPVNGVTVKDGLSVPHPTAQACYEATARGWTSELRKRLGSPPMSDQEIAERTPIDHSIIATLSYDAEKNRFQLHTNS